MEQLNRTVVRAFLSALVPRESPGVMLLAGTAELFVPRTAPIPWSALEEAVGRGEQVRVRFAVPAEPAGVIQAACVWVHLPRAGAKLQEVADALTPALPAALVAAEDCITAYWRVYPAQDAEASRLMAAIASVLGGSPGYPEETCPVPSSLEDLWVHSPPVIWTPEALLAAASCSGAAQKQRDLAGPQPLADTNVGEEVQTEPLWEEASRALSMADQDRLVACLLAALLEGSRDAEEAVRTLGVQAVATVGARPRVLRGGEWFGVALRKIELALVPDADGPSGEPQVQVEDVPDV